MTSTPTPAAPKKGSKAWLEKELAQTRATVDSQQKLILYRNQELEQAKGANRALGKKLEQLKQQQEEARNRSFFNTIKQGIGDLKGAFHHTIQQQPALSFSASSLKVWLWGGVALLTGLLLHLLLVTPAVNLVNDWGGFVISITLFVFCTFYALLFGKAHRQGSFNDSLFHTFVPKNIQVPQAAQLFTVVSLLTLAGLQAFALLSYLFFAFASGLFALIILLCASVVLSFLLIGSTLFITWIEHGRQA